MSRVSVMIALPEDVWGLIKEYAIPRCPACKGCCAYEDMPCWLDDLSQRTSNMPFMSAQHFREMWHKTEHARACNNSPELEELKRFWLDMNEYPGPGDDDDTPRSFDS